MVGIDEYIRKAKVLRVLDGNTIEVEASLGLGIKHQTLLLMAGCNAPDRTGATRAAGLASRDWLQAKLPVGAAVTVVTEKPNDKYGRFLAWVYLPGEDISVNLQMMIAGFAGPM